MCQTMYRRCLPDTRHTLMCDESSITYFQRWETSDTHGDDDMRHVAILSNHLESFDGFNIAHYVLQ